MFDVNLQPIARFLSHTSRGVLALATLAVFAQPAAQADPVRPSLKNNTGTTITGEVTYSACPTEKYRIGPGAVWRASWRSNTCYITAIRGRTPSRESIIPFRSPGSEGADFEINQTGRSYHVDLRRPRQAAADRLTAIQAIGRVQPGSAVWPSAPPRPLPGGRGHRRRQRRSRVCEHLGDLGPHHERQQHRLLKGFHGNYLVAEADGRATADRAIAREWEQWKLVDNRDARCRSRATTASGWWPSRTAGSTPTATRRRAGSASCSSRADQAGAVRGLSRDTARRALRHRLPPALAPRAPGLKAPSSTSCHDALSTRSRNLALI
ncbi:MAG: hypothetical protein R3F60_14680 [bacterium]